MKKRCGTCGLTLNRRGHYCPKCSGVMLNVGAEPEVKDEKGETDLSDYHVGGSWYEIEGEKIQGKKAARKALNERA